MARKNGPFRFILTRKNDGTYYGMLVESGTAASWQKETDDGTCVAAIPLAFEAHCRDRGEKGLKVIWALDEAVEVADRAFDLGFEAGMRYAHRERPKKRSAKRA